MIPNAMCRHHLSRSESSSSNHQSMGREGWGKNKPKTHVPVSPVISCSSVLLLPRGRQVGLKKWEKMVAGRWGKGGGGGGVVKYRKGVPVPPAHCLLFCSPLYRKEAMPGPKCVCVCVRG